MKADLVIKNARVFISDNLVRCGLSINEGVIHSIASSSNLPQADLTIDADGKIVLPGAIDVHVHFRDPGRTEREDFTTGTSSAACGGVTTIIDMPSQKPYVSDVEALKTKLNAIKGKALIDYALYGGVDAEKFQEISNLAEQGVVGYKVLMGLQTGFYPMLAEDDILLEAFTEIAKTGLVASLHAENWQIIRYYTGVIKRAGRKDPVSHAESRPHIAEIDAIARLILLAKETGLKLHIAHMSTSGGSDLVRSAKQAGISVTAETCPHYLLLTQEDMKKHGPYGKMNPPLRFSSDNEGLWNGLNDGTVDIICTDHAPQTPDEKEPGWDDIWACKGGIIGVETMLPLILSQVNSGRISLNRASCTMSANPAKIFGLYPKKGAIQVGSDADLVIVDPKKEMTIEEDKLHTKTKKTAFAGRKLSGVPIMTIVRGYVVAEDGEVVGKPGFGQWLKGTDMPKQSRG